MKSKLTLSNPLWQTTERRAILDKAVQQSGAELENLIKRKILDSTPRGRLYRRGAINRAASKKTSGLGLRRVANNPKRVIAGVTFHRASAKGQPPAVDKGELLNATRSKKTGEMRNKVANSKKYAPILDDPNGLDRPFFQSTADEFKAKFKQNIADVIRENS